MGGGDVAPGGSGHGRGAAVAVGRVCAPARDVFYKGDLARKMVRFQRETEVLDASGKAHSGLLAEKDFAEYTARVEPTVTTEYRGLTVHKCNTWCQGPVFLQQLNLLEGFDLRGLGSNRADYLHTVIECAKLAFADREAYYGDPQFVNVPLAAVALERVRGSAPEAGGPAPRLSGGSPRPRRGQSPSPCARRPQ